MAFIVTVQVPVPGQPVSDQRAKTDPAAGVAANVTDVLDTNAVEQSVPQLIPVGLEVTVPDPDPALVTVRVNACVAGGEGICVNVATTDLAASIVTSQVPPPEQPAPDQPEKTDP
ncbi:MAG: hypothetical protein AAB317_01555, partial [Nitrospirota bacterium]